MISDHFKSGDQFETVDSRWKQLECHSTNFKIIVYPAFTLNNLAALINCTSIAQTSGLKLFCIINTGVNSSKYRQLNEVICRGFFKAYSIYIIQVGLLVEKSKVLLHEMLVWQNEKRKQEIVVHVGNSRTCCMIYHSRI